MDQPIDFIYYSATTTDALGAQSFVQAQYYIPFFDFLLVFIVFVLTIMIVKLVDDFCYPKKKIIKIKNYLRIAKSIKKNF
jgi:Na+/H+-dicarboxylate symporter